MRDRPTFEQLQRSPYRARSGPVSIVFVPAGGDTPPRVAYAIGRRVGTAVVRNRLRRRLRQVVAVMADDLLPGAYLVAARPEAATLPFPELRTSVTTALRTFQKARCT